MDTVIKEKKKFNWRTLIAGLALCLVGFLSYQFMGQKKQASVQKDRLTIKTVKQDYFEDMALFSGKVEPLNTVLINTLESGSVRDILVEDGQMVKKGQSLLELYNPNTELNYLSQESILIEQINNLRSSNINIKNAQSRLDQNLLEADYNFAEAERKYQLDKSLHEEQLLPENDFIASENNYEYMQKQRDLIKNNIDLEKVERKSQLRRIQESIKKMELSLNKIQANRSNFIIKAGASGKLSSFNPVIGAAYTTGESLGKIDLMNGYKVVCSADEFYVSQVSEGQIAQLIYGGEEYRLIVDKILPEVIEGKFQFELKFESTVPTAIQRGMNLSIKLFFSDKDKKSLLLAKGGFYQSSGGKYVFVMVNENQAEKRNVRIGKSNPYYMEVTEGLSEGDKVITSSYDNFKTMEMINLK